MGLILNVAIYVRVTLTRSTNLIIRIVKTVYNKNNKGNNNNNSNNNNNKIKLNQINVNMCLNVVMIVRRSKKNTDMTNFVNPVLKKDKK